MIRGISSSSIQLNEKHRFPQISNFAYLQIQDSDSSRSPSSPLLHYQHDSTTPYQHHNRFRRRAKRGHSSIALALSANISILLEDLLKDYDKTERPGYTKGR